MYIAFRERHTLPYLVFIVVLGLLQASHFNLQSRYNSELEKDVARRTNELSAQLEQNDQLLRILAHDLKSPIDGVSSLARMLARTPDALTPDQLRSYIREIEAGATHISELTKNLLNWGRIKKPHIDAILQPYLLRDPTETIAPLFESTARRKDLRIHWDFPSRQFASFDFEAIATVLRNLLSNAIKYSTPGESILVRSKRIGDKAQIFVIDSGSGIPSHKLGPLREGKSIDSAPGSIGEHGTGIGLHICRSLLRAHTSELILESTPGVGTSAHFTLDTWDPPGAAD